METEPSRSPPSNVWKYRDPSSSSKDAPASNWWSDTTTGAKAGSSLSGAKAVCRTSSLEKGWQSLINLNKDAKDTKAWWKAESSVAQKATIPGLDQEDDVQIIREVPGKTSPLKKSKSIKLTKNTSKRKMSKVLFITIYYYELLTLHYHYKGRKTSPDGEIERANLQRHFSQPPLAVFVGVEIKKSSSTNPGSRKRCRCRYISAVLILRGFRIKYRQQGIYI